MSTVPTTNTNLAVMKRRVSSLSSPGHFIVSHLEQLDLFSKKALVCRQAVGVVIQIQGSRYGRLLLLSLRLLRLRFLLLLLLLLLLELSGRGRIQSASGRRRLLLLWLLRCCQWYGVLREGFRHWGKGHGLEALLLLLLMLERSEPRDLEAVVVRSVVVQDGAPEEGNGVVRVVVAVGEMDDTIKPSNTQDTQELHREEVFSDDNASANTSNTCDSSARGVLPLKFPGNAI